MTEMRKSDLFIERFGADAAEPLRFRDPSPLWIEGFDVSHAAEEDGGGSYHSVFCGTLWLSPPDERQRLVGALRRILVRYRSALGVRGDAPVLVAGLGNADAAADSLGARAVSRVLATTPEMRAAGLPEVCAVPLGVPSQTGLDTARHIRSLAGEIAAGLIVTVDALTARASERLGTVVQVTDCGVTPGSALRHAGGEISRKTMPCPVLSLGVPTVIRSDVLSGGEEVEDPMFVTRADTEEMVRCYAGILAAALNGFLTGNNPGEA